MPARPVDRGGTSSLWRQVRHDLLRRADEGEFDGAFPGENAIVAEYEVSRNTVREALRALRSEGLVSAERGRAPQLMREREIEQPMGALYSLFSSIESAGLRQHSVVRVLEVRADGVAASRLELEESTPLLYLDRVRLAGGEPLALDRVWLPALIAAPLLDADFTRTSLYRELATRCQVRLQGGHEQVRAVMISEGERRLLACPTTSAGFAIERLGRSRGRPVEWRQTIVRGDRFRFQADFSASGYQIDVASAAPSAVAPV